MPTPFPSMRLLCPAQFDTLITECHFFHRLCITVEVFICVDILILKYICKFAEFKHQVYIASEVISNS